MSTLRRERPQKIGGACTSGLRLVPARRMVRRPPPGDPDVIRERWEQLAALEDALVTLLRAPRPGEERCRRRVLRLAWLRSRDRSHSLTFERTCEALTLDASRLRARVLALCGLRRGPTTPTGPAVRR